MPRENARSNALMQSRVSIDGYSIRVTRRTPSQSWAWLGPVADWGALSRSFGGTWQEDPNGYLLQGYGGGRRLVIHLTGGSPRTVESGLGETVARGTASIRLS